MAWRSLSGLGLQRAPKHVLIEAYLELTNQPASGSFSHPATKAGLLKEVERLRDEERDRLFMERGKRRRFSDLCSITAAEVNEWLRTLPQEIA